MISSSLPGKPCRNSGQYSLLFLHLFPEGFASILWKDSRKAPEAAEVMKVTAAHLKELGIIERIIPEEYPASEENLPEIAEYMKIRMKQFLEKQTGKSGLQIAQERYERFRKM